MFASETPDSRWADLAEFEDSHQKFATAALAVGLYWRTMPPLAPVGASEHLDRLAALLDELDEAITDVDRSNLLKGQG